MKRDTRKTHFVPNGVQRMQKTSKTILLWEGTLRNNQNAFCFKWDSTDKLDKLNNPPLRGDPGIGNKTHFAPKGQHCENN